VTAPAEGAGVLVDAAWLDAHLHDPAVRVVEVDVSKRAQLYGHDDARILDCSRDAWRDAIGRPGRTLLDVRSRDEYRGERFRPSGGLEPGGRAGHVPSAVHQPIDGLYGKRGAFLDPCLLGRDRVRVYDGSWAEWGRMAEARWSRPDRACRFSW
jgi:thiosulfate/3-mercaptopyruvate sulfurtransferase